jgi:hydroxybutyrate-dimer hydrolase
MREIGLGASALAVFIAVLATATVLADDRDKDKDDDGDFGDRPGFITGAISRIVYDGVTDDLLTAGLGKSGLGQGNPPGLAFADPLNPTAAELRRRAIHGNYRALIDTTADGGYGRLYGPNVLADGTITDGEGLVAGVEAIAFANDGDDDDEDKDSDGSGRQNVTMMVQVPDSFDPEYACIVTGPSSGSRGVYGAIGTSGEWGLKNGCAVAYTDKGTGTGAHNLQRNTVGLIDGIRTDADQAGKASTFTASLSRRQRARFNARSPDRFAFKHAHSQMNPEKDWGKNVLQSIEFAFYVLNKEFPGENLTPHNTIVIASSVSNGGGSSVQAAEQDKKGLIDGIAVSEPNVNPTFSSSFTIVQGGGEPFADHSKSLIDYYTLLSIYLGCASAGQPLAPFNFAPSPQRCESLFDLGLLSVPDPSEAQQIINDFGFLTEQNILAPSHWFLNVPQGIDVTYANTYGRFSVTENVCGYSFGATDSAGFPTPLSLDAEAALFGVANGIPPTGGINLINNLGPNGPQLDRTSTPDQNLDGHLCLRSLATGRDVVTGERLRGKDRRRHRRILRGIEEIRASGDLDGLPAIFITGRADAILPPNHTSRAYFGLNNVVEGSSSNLSYVEVLNAQHLDVLNGFPGFNELYVPLHHYFIQALDIMLDHLRNDTLLPPSQVVRTTPRGEGAPAITLANLPPIAAMPDAGSDITFEGGEVRIPD